MNEENRKLIRDAVSEAGAVLDGQLPANANLKQRNSYAHLWERIKFTMGKSYKECEDSDIDQILEIIEYYRNNPC